MSLILQPNQSNIELSARALKNGALVGFPTETVYGLAADAENEIAVKRIYDVKRRPYDHPLIVHIGSLDYLNEWAINIPDYAKTLANEFWPGPMTLILERSKLAKDFITGNQNSVGVRIPNHYVATKLLQMFHSLGGIGLVAPSANRFGAVSPTDANAVAEEIGDRLNSDFDCIFDGGKSTIGIESTIINCLGKSPSFLRLGAITKADIERVIGKTELIGEGNPKIRHSGDMESHYSPKAKVFISGSPEPGDGFIASWLIPTPIGCIRLLSPRDGDEFAQNLYSSFREGDRMNLKRIFVVPPEGEGIEAAVRERLVKAAR